MAEPETATPAATGEQEKRSKHRLNIVLEVVEKQRAFVKFMNSIVQVRSRLQLFSLTHNHYSII